MLYVPLPGPAGRTSILQTLARKTPLAPDVNIPSLGEHPRAQGLSGADLQQLLREAAVASLKVTVLLHEKLAPSAVSHMVSPLRPYSTRQHIQVTGALARVTEHPGASLGVAGTAPPYSHGHVLALGDATPRGSAVATT